MTILMIFMALAFGQPADDSIIVTENKSDFQKIQIYVDISEVVAPDGSVGTSKMLNNLISYHGQSPDLLKGKLQYWSNPTKWNGEIDIYDWTNINYMPSFSECDYSDAVRCGIQNGHWTLKTIVTVGKKYSTLTQKMYDLKGRVIAQSERTSWGRIRWKPNWKLTTISEESPYGAAKKQVFEMWPPEMEELPPLITPFDVGQAKYGVFSINQSACDSPQCRETRRRY